MQCTAVNRNVHLSLQMSWTLLFFPCGRNGRLFFKIRDLRSYATWLLRFFSIFRRGAMCYSLYNVRSSINYSLIGMIYSPGLIEKFLAYSEVWQGMHLAGMKLPSWWHFCGHLRPVSFLKGLWEQTSHSESKGITINPRKPASNRSQRKANTSLCTLCKESSRPRSHTQAEDSPCWGLRNSLGVRI